MSLSKERKKTINLEKDLALSKEDFRALGVPRPHDPSDLGSYLDFLDELWGFQKKDIRKKLYLEPFRL
jgi:hypothetical protein